MKRLIRIIFIASVLVLAAASVNAATYKVKKGDNLSKIGKRYNLTWQAIAKANMDKVRNPRWIFPGQILTIPEIAKTAEDYTPVKSLGRRPFSKKRDVTKAIEMLLLPKEVKQLLIAKVKIGKFDWAALKKGDKREQMVFGNYRVQNKVIMDFAEGHLEAVRRYSVEWQSEIFHLEIPLKCDNPTWWKEKPELPPPSVEPEPEPQIEPELPPSPKPKKQLLLMMIPPPVVVKETPTEIPLPVVKKEACCQLDVDISVGAFADWHRSGNNPHGVWAVGNFYLYNFEDGDKLHSIGPALEGNYWRGVTGDDFHYFGSRYAVDGAYRLLTPATEFQFRAGLGQINDWGHIRTTNPAGKFRSSQTADIITAYTAFETKRDGGTRWFNRVRYYGQADFDIHRGGKFSWTDAQGIRQSVKARAGNKNSQNFGVDGSVYKLTKSVSLALGASATHYQAGNKTGLRASPGLDFYASNMPIGGLRFNATHWSDSDHSIGVGGFLDLTNLLKHLFPNLLPKKTFGGDEWQPEKPDQEKQEQTIQDIL